MGEEASILVWEVGRNGNAGAGDATLGNGSAEEGSSNHTVV